MRIQQDALRITLDHYRLGRLVRRLVVVVLRTLLHQRCRGMIRCAWGCGGGQGVRGRRGKVQLTFWHGLRGRHGSRLGVIDQVLGAFVLGRKVELDRFPLMAALLETAVVEGVRGHRHWFVLGAAGADDAPGASSARRVAGRRCPGAGIRVNTTIRS